MSGNNTPEQPEISEQDYLRLVDAAARKMGQAIGETDFPIVVGACMTMLEHCVRHAVPAARAPILENLRHTLDIIEAKVNAEQAVIDHEAAAPDSESGGAEAGATLH